MDYVLKAGDLARNFRQTRLSTLKPPSEFFDHRQLSRPKDLNEATSRITYNSRHFSGNYLLVIAVLAIYALITNYWLLVALGFLAGGFAAINKFGPEQMQKSLYGGLFLIGLPLLWLAAPVSTFFWLVGSSSVLIIGHACLMEPGVESEYGGIEGV